MKENRGSRSDDNTDSDYSDSERSGSYDYGGRRRSTPKAAAGIITVRPTSTLDIGTVERLRTAIAKSDHRRDWGDWFVIAGAILLAVSQMAVLVLASGINARANLLVANDTARTKLSGATVQRLEGKLDAHIASSDAHVSQPPPSVVINIHTPSTTIPRRNTPTTKVVADANVVPPKVERSTTSLPPATFAPATTLPPCRFALLNICLLR